MFTLIKEKMAALYMSEALRIDDYLSKVEFNTSSCVVQTIGPRTQNTSNLVFDIKNMGTGSVMHPYAYITYDLTLQKQTALGAAANYVQGDQFIINDGLPVTAVMSSQSYVCNSGSVNISPKNFACEWLMMNGGRENFAKISENSGGELNYYGDGKPSEEKWIASGLTAAASVGAQANITTTHTTNGGDIASETVNRNIMLLCAAGGEFRLAENESAFGTVTAAAPSVMTPTIGLKTDVAAGAALYRRRGASRWDPVREKRKN